MPALGWRPLDLINVSPLRATCERRREKVQQHPPSSGVMSRSDTLEKLKLRQGGAEKFVCPNPTVGYRSRDVEAPAQTI